MLRRVINSVAASASTAGSAAAASAAHGTPSGLGTVVGAAPDRAFSTTRATAAPVAAPSYHTSTSATTTTTAATSTSTTAEDAIPTPAASTSSFFARVSRHFTGASGETHENKLMHPQSTHTFFGAAIRSPVSVQKRKNQYGKKPIRAPRHGVSTVVGKDHVQSHADGFRAPVKAPPFPKPKFTRQLSHYSVHRQQQARAEYEKLHPELFQELPTRLSSVVQPKGTGAATAAATTAGVNAPKPSPSGNATRHAAQQSASLHAKAAVPSMEAALHKPTSPPQCATAADAAEPGSAVAQAPHHQPDMSKVTPVEPRVTSVTNPAAPASEQLSQMVDRLKRRVLAPLNFFSFSARDRMTIYFSMAVALVATYILYRLLYPELVYYGVLPSPIVKQKARATKAAAAAAAATLATGTSASATTPTASAAASSTPISTSASSSATSSTSLTGASAALTAPRGSRSSSSNTGAPLVPAALVLPPEQYLGIACVLAASTMPWHFFFLGTSSLFGRKAYAKKFLADWGRAILPTKAAAWYARVLRAPMPKPSA